MTGFLFQDTRCKCPPDQAFADGKMSDRFSKIKQANTGTIFTRHSDGRSGQSDAPSIGLVSGAIIGGAYKIVELIGQGGMGEVYLARHETLGKKCALKVIPPEQVTEMGWQRFQLEAKAVAKLEHINLVRVTDLGIHDGCLPYYAMDFVDGKNLADLLAQYGPMPLPVVLDVFAQVCDGVACAHRGSILHRDLKPANIMVIEGKNQKKLAKVLDFGLAKLTSHDRNKQSLTAVGDVFGSPFYMSPEQCNGEKLDRRSDIYSLGCTMFECLTGRPPFTGHLTSAVLFSQLEADPPSLESILGKGAVPASMEIVMAKLLRKNPVERYQTLVELRSDLERVGRGEDVEPFYVSRGKQQLSPSQGQGRGGGQEGEAGKEGANESEVARPLIAVAVVCTAVFALAALALLLVPSHPTKRSSIAGASSDLKNSSPEVKSAGLPGPAPFSSMIFSGGKRCRCFRFPADEILGIIQIGRDPGQRKKCIGEVIIPEGEELTFFVGRPCCAHPELLDRMRPDDFAVLRFVSISDEDRVHDALLEHITHLKGLTGVAVKQCRVTDKSLAYLDQLPGLRAIDLEETEITPAGLAKSEFLTRIRELSMQTFDNVTPVLERLKGSAQINYLAFEDTPLTQADYRLIGTLKNLRTLITRGCQTRNEDLVSLAALTNLVDLDVSEGYVDQAAVPILKKMHSRGLKFIHIHSSFTTAQSYINIREAGTGLIIR